MVQGLPFNSSLAASMAQAAQAQAALARQRNLILAGGLAAGLLLFALLLWTLVRALTRREPAPLPEAVLSPAAPGPEISPEDRTIEELTRLVRQNPDAAAEVVRGWLREE
jgi:flagellar biosynthesis/type III secretory pathway M-ring protein FliF/YscJ